MAYPFAQAPTTRDFVEKAKGLGCTCEQVDDVTGPRGDTVISYLKRKNGDGVLISEPLPEDPEERLAPDTLRRFCKQLKLDPPPYDFIDIDEEEEEE